MTASGRFPPECVAPERRRGSVRQRFLALWIVVSGFWLLATLLRVWRVWVPQIGWKGTLAGPWIWLVLLVPPLMFAVMIFSTYRMTKHHGSLQWGQTGTRGRNER